MKSKRIALSLLLLLCLPALAYAAQEAEEVWKAEDYGPHGLVFKHPVGFVDSQTISERLFTQTQAQPGFDGVLLKIYLPDETAHLYADNRPDAVTRQVCLYGVRNSQNYVLERRAVDLMFASLQGAYANFSAVSDSVRRDRTILEETLSQAARSAENLLVETLNGDFYQGYLTLVSYRMKDDFYLSTAMCTALVHVAETVVIINVSSIVTDDNVSAHTTWARNTAESFADMLVSANQGLQF